MQQVTGFIPSIYKVLQDLNLLVSGMMLLGVAWGIVIISVKQHKHPEFLLYPGLGAALLLWTAWWLILFVFYGIRSPLPYWASLLLVSAGNVALLGCAISLLSKDKAPNTFDFVSGISALSITLLVWNLLLGAYFEPAGQVWRVFVAVPAIGLGSVVFLFLAYSSAKRFPDFKAYIWVIFSIYAAVQLPAYYVLVISEPNTVIGYEAVIKSILGVGKFVILLLFLSILAHELRVTQAGGITIMKNVTAVLGILLMLTIGIARIHDFMIDKSLQLQQLPAGRPSIKESRTE